MKIGDEKIIFYFPKRALSDVLEDAASYKFSGASSQTLVFQQHAYQTGQAVVKARSSTSLHIRSCEYFLTPRCMLYGTSNMYTNLRQSNILLALYDQLYALYGSLLLWN